MRATMHYLFIVLVITLHLGSADEVKRKYPPFGRQMLQEFLIAQNYTQMNHGAFGPLSKFVMAAFQANRLRQELNPDRWYRRDAEIELTNVRRQIGDFIHADYQDIMMVPNGASGQNAIFRSIVFNPGERILYLSSIYEAVESVIKFVIDYSQGAVSSVVFNVTYPITNEEFLQKFESFLEKVDDPARPIRIALIDHITAFPPTVIPIERMIPMLKKRNITVVVDGAHAIGQIPINITALDPDYYVSNCHKWLFVARTCAILYVKKQHQGDIHPALISRSYRRPSDFADEFFWIGTTDYTNFMTVPAALQFRRDVGGEQAIMTHNHNLAWEGGRRMAELLGTRIIEQKEQLGSMVGVQLPLKNPQDPKLTAQFWIDKQLSDSPNTYAPVFRHNGEWWTRVSAQIYNEIGDFEILATHFQNICNEINGNNG